MFYTNIAMDQRGRHTFRWSITSARTFDPVAAAKFGAQVRAPVVLAQVEGRGGDGAKSVVSFARIEGGTVNISTIKPAEANGEGVVVRLTELAGETTHARLYFPLWPGVETARETSVIEDDTSQTIPIDVDGGIDVRLPPLGVKTLRLSRGLGRPETISNLTATAVSDVAVALRWLTPEPATTGHVDFFRDEKEDFAPSLLNWVGRSAIHAGRYDDRPRLDAGGWLSNRLQPGGRYWYKAVVTDQFFRRSLPSPVVATRTFERDRDHDEAPAQTLPPRAVAVSPLSADRAVQLWFRTGVEDDLTTWSIERTAEGDGPYREIASLSADEMIGVPTKYGPLQSQRRELEFQTFQDRTVVAGGRYGYRVCARDRAGHPATCSSAVQIQIPD
jgi:hypothetical protein